MGTARTRIRRRQLAAIMVVACVVTPVFNVLTNEATVPSAIQGSQFTTGGAENPTLTIVALAIRQAEYIAQQMQQRAI